MVKQHFLYVYALFPRTYYSIKHMGHIEVFFGHIVVFYHPTKFLAPYVESVVFLKKRAL